MMITESEIANTVIELLGYLLFFISEFIGLSTCESNAVLQVLILQCFKPKVVHQDQESQTEEQTIVY